ncbi:hypothetical protein [Kitasatospora purpeofusca]|uniref:hypothetical protein n=1 Tax=Kitasatospora purpeofusca TaxID=67352 RepID=UPI0037FB4253
MKKHFTVLDALVLILAGYLAVRAWQHGETWQNAGLRGLVIYAIGYGVLHYLFNTPKAGTTQKKGRSK